MQHHWFLAAVQVITPLLKVLHSLHQLGVIHRDSELPFL
jgi:hypothetical protein